MRLIRRVSQTVLGRMSDAPPRPAEPAAAALPEAPAGQPDETRRIIGFWDRAGAGNFHYFGIVETEANTDPFWDPQGTFRPRFDLLDTTETLEIACGFGRHSARIAERCRALWLLDTSPDALAEARRRFAGLAHVGFIHSTDGRTIALPDASCTAVFSYDAMVHFEMEDVFSYLRECHRVLRPGGRCLLHHSAYDAAPGTPFDGNPGWRNFMSLAAFRHAALRAGFTVLSTDVFDWNAPGTDALSLLQR